jgi:D-alanyl-D-alanine carboxypeptidase
MRRYGLGLMLVFFCCFPVLAQDTDLQTLLEQVVAPTDNGIVILVRQGDETLFAYAGLADLEKGIEIQPGDAFRIASVSKPFLAIMLLQLQEEGVLSLDDPILSWLPDAGIDTLPYVEEIEIRELLNMSSGIFNYTESESYYEASSAGSYPWTAQEMIPFILEGDPYFQPGEGYYYSNSNYILAQLILENATGNSLSEELQTRIFEPVGMEHSFLEQADTVGEGIIQGYSDEDENGVLDNVTFYNDGIGLGDGGIISTVEDLALFADSLIISHTLLSEASWQEMTQMVDTVDDGEYGLGLDVRQSGDAIFLGHTGATSGFLTQLWADPERGIIIVMFTNNFNSEILSDGVEEVMAWVLQQE